MSLGKCMHEHAEGSLSVLGARMIAGGRQQLIVNPPPRFPDITDSSWWLLVHKMKLFNDV